MKRENCIDYAVILEVNFIAAFEDTVSKSSCPYITENNQINWFIMFMAYSKLSLVHKINKSLI